MISEVASNMKFGVVVVREFEEYNAENLMPLVDSLQMLGCTDDNIVVKFVPTAHDVVIATQFMAEYTDVDGVIILAPQNRIMGTLSVMNGIVQIQIHWNMVVEIGGAECAENVVEMVAIQSEMEMEAPDMVNGQQSFS
jgi:6,7-dimethyl-8-ribityllumazine synthase